MTLRQYLSIMILATALCWGSLIFVLFNVNPYQGGLTGFILFYLSAFFSILGTLSLVIFTAYHIFGRHSEPMFKYVQYSFRNSIILSCFSLVLLLLQAGEYLHWWNFGILGLLVVIVLVYVFFTRKNIPVSKNIFNSPNLTK